MKKLLNHIFIDGLSGMALGLFSTLIVGTIIQQIGNLIGGNIGDMLFIMVWHTVIRKVRWWCFLRQRPA